MNRNLRELHLAENKLTPFDALQLGILLTGNSSLQHVDLRLILYLEISGESKFSDFVYFFFYLETTKFPIRGWGIFVMRFWTILG